jgi:hypothetical protein
MIGARGAVLIVTSVGFWASNGAAALLKYKMAIVRIKQTFLTTSGALHKKVLLGSGTFDSAKGKGCKQERNATRKMVPLGKEARAKRRHETSPKQGPQQLV